jgi:hypothetical protein
MLWNYFFNNNGFRDMWYEVNPRIPIPSKSSMQSKLETKYIVTTGEPKVDEEGNPVLDNDGV